MEAAVNALLRLVLPTAGMVAVIGALPRRALVLLGVVMVWRPKEVLSAVEQILLGGDIDRILGGLLAIVVGGP
ncbi:MAG: hypothetical protein OXH69_23230 [Acidobacteria bacterium]|nr:hypothetical protein [Acidobacteriota bacterium]